MGEYYRLCKTVHDYGKFISVNEDVYKHIDSFDVPYYKSIYRFTEEQKKQAEEIITVKGKNRPRGVSGITDVTTSTLVWDFDNINNIEQAQKDAIELFSRLREHGIGEPFIQIYFSGKKGFGIEVETNGKFTPGEFKSITSNLAKDLETYDSTVSNPVRILRLPYTKHNDTKYYKTPLEITELKDLTIEQIKNVSNGDCDVIRYPRVGVPKSILAYRVKLDSPKNTNDNKKVVQSFEIKQMLKRKPKHLSPWKFALSEGYFPSGMRSYACMILAATYHGLGLSETNCYYALKAAVDLQAKLHDNEKFSKEEIYKTIISQVYSPVWQGGTYSEDTFPQELQDYLIELGVPRLTKEDKTALETVDDVYSTFEDYAVNIDKNTITTGIPELDDLCRITTSMLVGVLGCPACHEKGTKILMFDGSLKNVEDVQVGDFLMGPDSKPREVLKLHSGKDKMVRITPKRSESFVVNMHHILNLKQNKTSLQRSIPGSLNISVLNYIKGIENKSSLLSGYRLHKTGVEYSEKDLEIDPYFLGLWLGDETCDSAEITTIDAEVIEFLTEYSSSIGLELVKKDKCGKSHVYRLKKLNGKTNNIIQDLRNLNLFKNKHIPQKYLTSSREQRLRLLAGLIDSDGSLESNGCGYIITQKNDILLKNIQILSRSLGLHCSLNSVEKYCIYKGEKRNGVYNSVYISGLDEISNIPIKIQTKKVKRIMTSKDPSLYGFDYDVLEEGEYFGFTIDKDHLYLTEDFIVHHNSGKTAFLLNVLNHMSLNGEKSVFFSLDMGKPLVYQKMAQKLLGYESDEIFKIFQNNKEFQKKEIRDEIAKNYSNTKICFRTGSTVDDLREYIINYEQETGEKIRLVAVDYLEKVAGPFSDATANSGHVAKQLQALANDLEVCVIVLLQPQKLAGDPRDPLLTYRRIKGASLLEQDCRVILSLWRPGFDPQSYEDDDYISFAVLKNTMGNTGQVDCSWVGLTGNISPLDDSGKQALKDLIKRKQAMAKLEQDDI